MKKKIDMQKTKKIQNRKDGDGWEEKREQNETKIKNII